MCPQHTVLWMQTSSCCSKAQVYKTLAAVTPMSSSSKSLRQSAANSVLGQPAKPLCVRTHLSAAALQKRFLQRGQQPWRLCRMQVRYQVLQSVQWPAHMRFQVCGRKCPSLPALHLATNIGIAWGLRQANAVSDPPGWLHQWAQLQNRARLHVCLTSD
jgi:hypothetical protein